VKRLNSFINSQELSNKKEDIRKNKEIEDFKEKVKKLEEENEVLKKGVKESGSIPPPEGSISDQSGAGKE
jgi:flagellar motility protein MotE (MotC chaperone)